MAAGLPSIMLDKQKAIVCPPGEAADASCEQGVKPK